MNSHRSTWSKPETGPKPIESPHGYDSAPGAVPIRSIALTLVAVGTGILLLRYMQDVLIPMVLAGLIFYALDPFVDRLQRWRVPRAVGAALVLISLVALVGSVAYSLSDDVTEIATDLPAAAEKLRDTLRVSRQAPAGALEKAATAIDKTADEAVGATAPPRGVTRVQLEAPRFRVGDYLHWGTAGIVSLASGLVMILFLAYFLLVTDDLFKRKLIEIIGPTLTRQKLTVQGLNQIASQIESFLLIQIATSVAVGVATWLALWGLGLHNAMVWGLCAGILNSVPYFGPLIVTLALGAIAYVQFGTIGMALSAAGIALLITSLEGWLLTPMLMGRVAQMNTVAIFTSLLFWSWLWGIWGLLLAVPIMMVVKAVCDRVDTLQPIGTLLGD